MSRDGMPTPWNVPNTVQTEPDGRSGLAILATRRLELESDGVFQGFGVYKGQPELQGRMPRAVLPSRLPP